MEKIWKILCRSPDLSKSLTWKKVYSNTTSTTIFHHKILFSSRYKSSLLSLLVLDSVRSLEKRSSRRSHYCLPERGRPGWILHWSTKIGLWLEEGFFSDETQINRNGSDWRRWAWKLPGECLTNRLVEGGSLMIWGYMSWAGKWGVWKIDSRMDGDLYVQILEEDP